MNQQQLWNSKWKNLYPTAPVTSFAKRAVRFLKGKNKRTLLELGCGKGTDAIYFSKNGYNVTAVDFAESAIENLKRRTDNVKAEVADILNYSSKKKFDVIFANLSLHYFTDKDTRKIFKNISNLLKDDGYLFVRCKSDKDFLYGKGKTQAKDEFIYKNKFIHFFSKDYIKENLKDLEIIKLRRTTSRHLTMENGVVKASFIEAVARK